MEKRKASINSFVIRATSVPKIKRTVMDPRSLSKDNLKPEINAYKRRSNLITENTVESKPDFYQSYMETYKKLKEEVEDVIDRRKISKPERHQNFVYDRRAKEPFAHSEKKKIFFQPIPICRGMSSLMVTKDVKGDDYLRVDVNAKISKRTKFIVKWNMFQWLAENKKDVVNTLWKNYSIFIGYIKMRGHAITKFDFMELMKAIGLEKEHVLSEKIFWALDTDNSGDIDHRELITVLEFFRENTFDDKLLVFFDVCDLHNTGTIIPHEFYDLLKVNVMKKEDKIKLKRIFKTLFKEEDINEDGSVSKNAYFKTTSTNRELRIVLEDSMRMIKKVDKYINSNFQDLWHGWPPGGSASAKEGTHFIENKKFFETIKKAEEAWETKRLVKKDIRDEFRRVKGAQGIEMDAEQEEYEI